MIKSRITVASALLAVAGAANAGVTATPTLTTDYDFRGLTQTDGNMAAQLGLNVATESGWYFGTWASNVDLVTYEPDGSKFELDAVWEIDGIVGFAGGDAAEGFGYDVGAIVYVYPSSKHTKDIYEVYAGISKGWFSGKLSIAPDNYNKKSFYAETNATIPLPQDFSLGVHVGYSFGEYWKHYEYDVDHWNSNEFLDYSIGVTKTLGNFALNVKYVNSNDFGGNISWVTWPGAVGRNAIITSISTTLPWTE